MNKYKLIGALAAALAAAVCFYAYFRGGEGMYGAALILASVSFGIVGYSELMTSREGSAGAFSYIKPAFYFILAVLTLAASVWLYAAR